MLFINKKGAIGVGTLIIFIGFILVASISAGTIMRTAGILQQRSYFVGSKTKEKITTFFEIISIFGKANISIPAVEELTVYLKILQSSKNILPKQIFVVLSPFNILYCYNPEKSFYNQDYNVPEFCYITNLTLDLNLDCIEDYLAIESNAIFLYLNETQKVFLTSWNSGEVKNEVINVEIDSMYFGKIYFNGTLLDDNCSNISITVFPAQRFGHFQGIFYTNESYLRGGDTLKLILRVPYLYEGQEYALSVGSKDSILSQTSFDVPSIYTEYFLLR
ncbi:MAG: hypothetical protein QW524_02985 [Candidatus Woesearchaeota archaeon]